MAKATTANTTQKETNAMTNAKNQGEKVIDFVKLAPLMGGLSLLLCVISLGLLMTKGLNYGIDFTGGTEVQVRFDKPVDPSALRASIEGTGISNPSVQSFGSSNEFLIRLESPKGANEKETNTLVNQNVAKVRTALVGQFGMKEEGLLRVDSVGPQVGSELKRNGVLAAFYSFLAILIYVALRFDYKYAPGAVICLVHDCLITIGVFALLGREFNVQIMAAVLTLIGYSLNDTIVTFDRIREIGASGDRSSTANVINKGITETLSRTILTAGTTMLAVIALYIFAGGVIEDIAFTLMIGIVVGAYSSIYVAAPLILVMEKFKRSSAAA